MNKDKERLENKATTDHAYRNPSVGHCCDEELLFAMRDNHHEFTLGITIILNCLLVAQEQGAVPVLPDHWWQTVSSRYRLTQINFEAETNHDGCQ